MFYILCSGISSGSLHGWFTILLLGIVNF